MESLPRRLPQWQRIAIFHWVQKELEAQIKRFDELVGRMPEYVDGHQHIHVLPGVCGVFAKVLKAVGIASTRLPWELGLEQENCPWIDEDRLSFYTEVSRQAQHAAHIFNNSNIRFAAGFVGMRTMGSDMTVERLEDCLLRTFSSVECGGTAAGEVSHDGSHQPTHCDSVCGVLPPHSQLNRTQTADHRHDIPGHVARFSANTRNPVIMTESMSRGAVMMTESMSRGAVMMTESMSRGPVTVELMVHPGYPCSETVGGCGVGPDDFARSPDRQHEMDVLGSESLGLFLQKHSIQLVAHQSHNT